MSTPRFYNPLTVKSEVQSVSKDSEVKSTSSFSIENPEMCPKCDIPTSQSKLRSGETVMFCTHCRVSMALPL